MWFLLFVVHQITVPGTLPTTATGCGCIHPAPLCPIFYLWRPLGHSGDVQQLQSQCDLERKIRSESNSTLISNLVRVGHCTFENTTWELGLFLLIRRKRECVCDGRWWTVQTFSVPHRQSEAEQDLIVPATCPTRRHVWSKKRKLVWVFQPVPQ